MKPARISSIGSSLLHGRKEGRSTGPSDRRVSAFTLVELLVVIAVIAILASLLIPALARAKAQGQKAICINNFRQLHLAWHMYIDDSNGHLPYNDLGEGAGEKPNNPNWVAG